MTRFLLALVAAAFAASSAVADAPAAQQPITQEPLPPVPPLDAPEPERAAKSGDRAGVHSFGRDKACTEWSDGCVVCRRAGPEETACSTTGVACTPAEPTCRKPK